MILTGTDSTAGDFGAENRTVALPRLYSERELSRVLRRLLEVATDDGEPISPLVTATEETAPHVQIAQPDATLRALAGHVLLVEDNAVNRQVAQRLLTLSGVTFVAAENGEEALEKLQERIVRCRADGLPDAGHGRLYGYARPPPERDRRLRRRIPIIAMTANAMAGDREKCLNAGMDDYMSKPLNRALLEQTLRKWLPLEARTQTQSPAEARCRCCHTGAAVAKRRLNMISV